LGHALRGERPSPTLKVTPDQVWRSAERAARQLKDIQSFRRRASCMTNLAIMNAPNGARPTAADHPRLPLTIDAIAEDAAAVAKAGAQAVHIHVRDEQGRHVLDAARHLAAEQAIRRRTGDSLVVQMTTEAVGRYTPRQQIELVQAVAPEAVSIAMTELMPDASAEAS